MKKLFCLMLLYSILNIVHAQQWQSVTNAVTPSALRGGNEANGTVLYIARVKHENGVHIGKARPNSREAFIAYGGKELALSNYEVFTGTGQWVKATANSFPPNAIAGGYEANGAPLYIARAVIDGGYHPGKARKNGDGFIPYGGIERVIKDYEVLTSNPVATITPGTYHIRSQIENKPMDVVNGQNANGNGLHLWDFHGGDAQQFTIEPSNEAGYYYIKTKWGRVLTIKDRSNASGATLYTWDFQGGDNQKWRFINRGNGYYNIESKYRTYIDVKGGGNAIGTPIHLSDYSMWGNNIAQLWKLEQQTNFSRFPIPPVVFREQTPLNGWVDMHTHPMSHLGFGGKCIHGAPDVGVLVPAIPKGEAFNTIGCFHYKRAANINEALCDCNVTHGGFSGFDNKCGDDIRKMLIRETEKELDAKTGHHEEGARGFPALNSWPAYNDLTHQQMWIDWVKRTYQNGLRIMVSLSVNNATYSAGFSGPGDINPDDVSSSNIQIEEIIKMVNRHNGSAGSVDNWMEIAFSAKDVRRIVNANKLAIVLGMEVDNIGNFHKNNNIDPYRVTEATKAVVRNEIDRIYNQGVRYIFPIHVVDNKFGGSAVYQEAFDFSNYHQTGKFWDIECASSSDSISYNYTSYKWTLGLAGAKMGVDVFRRPPTPPSCTNGHKNKLGLTPLGEFAIQEMMKKGMIIDIDHMSDKAVDKTLEIAERFSYPVNSGHNGIRIDGKERAFQVSQYKKISRLGGMAGLGMAEATAASFKNNYLELLITMNYDGVAIGTDANGMEKLPMSTSTSSVGYNNSFQMCKTGNRTWDYNKEGVAHYGLLPDFFKDVQNQVGGQAAIDALNRSAEYFAKMWEKCERQKSQIR